MNDSKKILTPKSTSTITTNKKTNNANINNSDSNTSSNLIPSSIDEERNESEECDNTYGTYGGK